jgi:hypothetical protein
VIEEADTHEVTVSVVNTPTTEVDGTTALTLNLRAICSIGCDLWGKSIQVLTEDGTLVIKKPLLQSDGSTLASGEIVVQAPFEPGEHSWTVLFPAQTVGGVPHKESSTTFPIVVKPHATRVKVWQVPPTVIASQHFVVNVGVECSSQCSLAGQKIEIRDQKGTRLVAAILGEHPHADSKGLYWTEVELEAPISEGRFRWTAAFPGADVSGFHKQASCDFSSAVVREGECLLTIEAVSKELSLPARNARVLIRPQRYRGFTYENETDEEGIAEVRLPAGEYQVYVRGEESEVLFSRVQVAGDCTIRAELTQNLDSWRMIG